MIKVKIPSAGLLAKKFLPRVRRVGYRIICVNWPKKLAALMVVLPVALAGWLFVTVDIRINNKEVIAQRAAALGGLGLTPYFVYHSTPPMLVKADKAALRHGVPPLLFRALVTQESSWNPTAVSSKGAVGLTQLMPATARTECGLEPKERFDQDKNLDCGARYLGKLIRRFDSIELALAAYNSGPSRVARLGRVPRIRETQNYVARIMANWEESSS